MVVVKKGSLCQRFSYQDALKIIWAFESFIFSKHNQAKVISVVSNGVYNPPNGKKTPANVQIQK